MLTHSSGEDQLYPNEDMSTMTLPNRATSPDVTAGGGPKDTIDGRSDEVLGASIKQDTREDQTVSISGSRRSVAESKYSEAMKRLGSHLSSHSSSQRRGSSLGGDSERQKNMSTVDKWNQFKDTDYILPPRKELNI